jgi:hypothetical protein
MYDGSGLYTNLLICENDRFHTERFVRLNVTLIHLCFIRKVMLDLK